jgi:hypothetical protein
LVKYFKYLEKGATDLQKMIKEASIEAFTRREIEHN